MEKYPDIFENVVSPRDYKEKDINKGGIVLKDEAGTVITTCYSPHPGRFGW